MKSVAIMLAVNLAMFLFLATIVEALKRRGIDPVTKGAMMLSPAPTGAAAGGAA